MGVDPTGASLVVHTRGVDIVRRAVVAPIKQIALNAGLDGSIVAQKVMESADKNFGYDALAKKYGDLIKFGVIVPTKVERTALQNGASIASLLGASFAGEKVMTATSGPGLALMGELLNMASMTELPVVIVDVQRGGPSTGLPTKTNNPISHSRFTERLENLLGRSSLRPRSQIVSTRR